VILVSDSRAQYAARRAEIDDAIARVLASGRYILGEEVAAFEREFAAYCGAAHGVGVNSGTDALIIALRALGIGEGDEVITVSHTAVATVAAIVAVRAHPVLVDIDPATFAIDPAMVERAIGPRTRAIIPVHLYGLPADMGAVMDIAGRHGLKVIEDCAQATGARHRGQRVGAIGHVGCFSFYPTKNLGAVGDGGLIVTNDDEVAARARALRQYGWNDARDSQLDGVNSRLDEVQAAVLRAKLPHLETDNRTRAGIAAFYNNSLSDTGLGLPRTLEQREHVYHLYVVRSADRDRLREALRESGIAAGIHYPVPVHLQPAFRDRGMTPSPLPHSEQAAAQILSLPLYPELTDDQLQTVVSAIRAQTTMPDKKLLRTS
jgi:dTDP-4-amino-4,6-dideoxygalactose transaminase